MKANDQKTCPRCRQTFECGLSQSHETCWCFDCPRMMPVVENADCLCPDCLKAEITSRMKSERQASNRR